MELPRQSSQASDSSWDVDDMIGVSSHAPTQVLPPPYEPPSPTTPSPTSSGVSWRTGVRPLPSAPRRPSAWERASSSLDTPPRCLSEDASSCSRSRLREPLPRPPSPAPSEETMPPSYVHATPNVSVPLVPSLLSTSTDLARLSHVAQLLSCVIPRQPLIKGSVIYPLGFTGRTLVSTLADMLSQYVHVSPGFVMCESLLLHAARSLALSMARSLQTQLYLHEADWEDHPMSDDVGGVYMLYSDRVHTDKTTPAQVAMPGLSAELFVSTPWNTIALSPVAAAAAASAPSHDLPTGLFTPLTRCYSPTCSHTEGACYAPSCPRTNRMLLCVAEEPRETVDTVVAAAWVETVPAALAASLPREEVKRQNAIYEFVQKEEAFLHDLGLLRQWEERLCQRSTQASVGLLEDAPLRGEALESFVRDVFGLVAPLQGHIQAFVDRLLERQREEAPVVQHIADVFVRAALEWSNAYTEYVVHYPLALARFKAEVAGNARLRHFVEDCRRDPAAQRHALDQFLFRPPARLQRYHLHLESIAKYTPPDHEDTETITLAMSIIDEQCRRAQTGVEENEMQLRLRHLASQLEPKRSDVLVDLNLWHPQRRIHLETPLFRWPDNFEFEWTEMRGILLDNYMVLAKPRPEDEGAQDAPGRLVYSKRPIPVACLDAGGFHDTPVGRSSVGRRLLPTDVHGMYPFSVWHRFRPAQVWTMYAPSEEVRQAWRHALSQAATSDPAAGPFMRCDCSGDVFRPPIASPGTMLAWRDSSGMADITCTASWRGPSGEALLAIGTAEGVWIGHPARPTTLRKVLHVRHVTQCAVLAPYHRFLVLADRTLIAYDLEALVPSGTRVPSLAPLRLSNAREVQFFALGELDGRPYLVYAKRKATETSVRVMVPVASVASDRHPAALTGFHLLHKFYVYPEATHIQCSARVLLVTTARAVFTYSLEEQELVPFPAVRQRDERRQALLRQWDSAHPLGAFAVPDMGWLVCYDRGCLYVDADGQLAQAEKAFTWEAPAQRVLFHDGYVLAGCASCVEVREARTGHLAQILAARDLRLLSRQDAATEPQLSAGPLPALVELRKSAERRDMPRVVALMPRDTQSM
ncbi:Rho guanine nucleotide exchange factor [Malassezia caprae]|uniref:Rho guanine nucleotide exchange factor n=1 Tax=Malassezia caprae TaxID=1381934 RepID=A0AAF0E5B8_9BASI|nr:Rho guanine nucleotide exchange factor [Malassezia caprae]